MNSDGTVPCDGTCCMGHPGFGEYDRDDPDIAVIVDWFQRQPDGTYMCKYLDPERRLCTIYDKRPAFCRAWWCHDHDESTGEDTERICGPRDPDAEIVPNAVEQRRRKLKNPMPTHEPFIGLID